MMITPDGRVEIKTLGCFRITRDGKPVATDWPDETGKALFCSLLSPLDLNFTLDYISRSILNEPKTEASRRHLKYHVIRPLKSFLQDEFGFNPLMTVDESIGIDRQRLYVDAFDFYDSVVGGLKLLSYGFNAKVLQKLQRAWFLYNGSYLPDMEGKIIANTRADLESLYDRVVTESIWSKLPKNAGTPLPMIGNSSKPKWQSLSLPGSRPNKRFGMNDRRYRDETIQ